MTNVDEAIVKFIIDYYKQSQFYPSYDEIAENVDRNKSTIHTHMKKLEAEGVIIRKADYSHHYRLINMEFIMSENQSVSVKENKDGTL